MNRSPDSTLETPRTCPKIGVHLCRTWRPAAPPRPIDTLAAAGVLMADIWKDERIVTIDMLGDEFLETVQMGDPISIHEDGTVEVG